MDRKLANDILVAQSDVPSEMYAASNYLPDAVLRRCVTRKGFAYTAWAGSPTYADPRFIDHLAGISSVATVLKTTSAAKRYYRFATRALLHGCLDHYLRRHNALLFTLGDPHKLSFPHYAAQSAAWRQPVADAGNDGAESYTFDVVLVRQRRAVLVDDFFFWLGWPALDRAAPSGLTLAGLERQAISGQLARSQYTLTIREVGPGYGFVTSQPAGFRSTDCTNGCSAAFPAGTKVTLSVTPAQGAVFSYWSGGCLPAARRVGCVITMDSDKKVGAHFG